jgi:hypothetical protein
MYMYKSSDLEILSRLVLPISLILKLERWQSLFVITKSFIPSERENKMQRKWYKRSSFLLIDLIDSIINKYLLIQLEINWYLETRDKTFPKIMFPACKLDTNYGFPELFLNSDKQILHSDTSFPNLKTKRYWYLEMYPTEDAKL